MAQFVMVLDQSVMNVSISALVEDFDTDIKLGQAMITTSYTHDKAGTYTLYAMSWARPLVFPGPFGRPTLPVPVDNDIRVYESPLNAGQIDVAFQGNRGLVEELLNQLVELNFQA